MALLVRIYFNAVFGALGGLVGWVLFGVFGDKAAMDQPVQWLLGGALIGGSIGYFVVSVDAIRDRSLVRFSRLAAYGVLLAAFGGALGFVIAEVSTNFLNSRIGATSRGTGSGFLVLLILTALARGLSWMFLGLFIGVSEGIAARSLAKLSYGTLGGVIGGFVGGCLFGLMLEVSAGEGNVRYLLAALGLVILGASIGSLSAFVQGVLQPGSLRVLRGWQEGREYPVLGARLLLGRAEDADIALFRDMKIEKRHAYIVREGNNRFILINNNAPAEFTRVNDEPVMQRRDLRDGDRIQLGNTALRFQMKAAQGGTPRRAARVVAVPRQAPNPWATPSGS
jgi:hypothetical protein